ncbi:YiiX/YebB-like N1pC/P60 family cysteine hydrolase [uncultured Bacteroides sp.]|uniref:YiiX/YebB-like N1pC/P60 family cysteine hydrolase n=1 Tax=uncultured Bacteroides sp. TaxID=162156 RepID=UPI00260CB27E|nr:YiiX/YebB-like N1pC/P60 family cysteine hydrolase [uncultured Bacteroides sp.]
MSVTRVWIVGLFLLLGGCTHSGKEDIKPIISADTLDLKEGDLLFRKGQGFESRMILLADPEGRSTHVGILVDSCGYWMVIHAVPGEPDFPGDPDRVKMEAFCRFYGSDRADEGEIMRQPDSIAALNAARIALATYRQGVLFDNDFDEADTTRMYCTEFINYVYMRAGVRLVGKERRRLNVPVYAGTYLFPSDIQASSKLSSIIRF